MQINKKFKTVVQYDGSNLVKTSHCRNLQQKHDNQNYYSKEACSKKDDQRPLKLL